MNWLRRVIKNVLDTFNLRLKEAAYSRFVSSNIYDNLLLILGIASCDNKIHSISITACQYHKGEFSRIETGMRINVDDNLYQNISKYLKEHAHLRVYGRLFFEIDLFNEQGAIECIIEFYKRID